MTSRGGKHQLLNTDSSLESIKLSTNFTSHRERPQLIKVQEIKYLEAQEGWRRYNSVSSQQSSDEKDFTIGSSVTSILPTKHLVNTATAKHMLDQKQEIDSKISLELAQFQALVSQKEQVIRELEGQLRTREKLNAKRQYMYTHDIKDKLKQAEDKLRHVKAKAEQKEEFRDQMRAEVEQAEEELAEMKAKVRAKKESNEERVRVMREKREDMEY